MIGNKTFSTITAGIEQLPAGIDKPRHRHFDAYVTIVLDGLFEQLSYAGRLVAEAGDVMLQPTLDCHANRMLSPGVDILRFPWKHTSSFGGIFRAAGDIDEMRRAATRDHTELIRLLDHIFDHQTPIEPIFADWEDELAMRLRSPHTSISQFADETGLPLEVVSRGFSKAYEVSPATFRGELRARDAWLQIISTTGPLCDIALDSGFSDQSHMTRAVRALTGSTPALWRNSARLSPGSSP